MNEFHGVYSEEVTAPYVEKRGGKRLGAGRKVTLENQTIEKVKRYSASTILKILRDKNADLELRADISTRVFLKAMPNKLEGEGIADTRIVQVYIPQISDGLETAQRAPDIIPSESSI